jgi:hypothetical protein
MKLTIGRLVRYVLAESDLPETHKNCAGQVIVALIVGIDEDGKTNLTGFPDVRKTGLPPVCSLANRKCAWPIEPGTWHWPPDLMALDAQRRKEREAQKKKPAAAAVSEA